MYTYMYIDIYSYSEIYSYIYIYIWYAAVTSAYIIANLGDCVTPLRTLHLVRCTPSRV